MLRNALEGLTVIDFTQIGAGPTCTMLLADMGARVIKVEPPEGELGRSLGPAWIGDDSALFHAFNRNKLGLCLDLKRPEGLAVAKRLVAQADVLIESMRPGVMKRLGLGYERPRCRPPAPRLLLGLRLRSEGSVFEPCRCRRDPAGRQRPDEPHRHARRRAVQGAGTDRRRRDRLHRVHGRPGQAQRAHAVTCAAGTST